MKWVHVGLAKNQTTKIMMTCHLSMWTIQNLMMIMRKNLMMNPVLHMTMIQMNMRTFQILKTQTTHHFLRRFKKVLGLFYNPFQTTVNTSEAESVRKVYDEASEKLSTLKSKICRLTKKLVNDFGPKKEFYSCFKTKQNKFQPF